MLQQYGIPTPQQILIKWKQSKEGLQGGLQEIIDTPLVSLLC